MTGYFFLCTRYLVLFNLICQNMKLHKYHTIEQEIEYSICMYLNQLKITENVIILFQWDFTKLRTIKWLWRFSIDKKSNLWMWLEKSDVKFRIWNCSDILISSNYIKYVLDLHYKKQGKLLKTRWATLLGKGLYSFAL